MEIIRVDNTKDRDAWLLFEKTYNEIENKEKTLNNEKITLFQKNVLVYIL